MNKIKVLLMLVMVLCGQTATGYSKGPEFNFKIKSFPKNYQRRAKRYNWKMRVSPRIVSVNQSFKISWEGGHSRDQFKYWIKQNGKKISSSKWIRGKTGTAKVKKGKPGTYEIFVACLNGSVGEPPITAGFKSVKVIVADDLPDAIKMSPVKPRLNQKVKFTLGIKSKKYQYSWQLYKNGKPLMKSSKWSGQPNLNWKFSKSGKYGLRVRVRSSGIKMILKELRKKFSIK
ncbi:hypothetical protein KAJ27_22165 [bacterium]|nr:hypothetical protein [bacterium]